MRDDQAHPADDYRHRHRHRHRHRDRDRGQRGGRTDGYRPDDGGVPTQALPRSSNKTYLPAAAGGLTVGCAANLVPTDGNAIAFGRTPGKVLNLVYLNPKKVSSGVCTTCSYRAGSEINPC